MFSGENEHEHFCSHTDRKQETASGEVQDFEQSTPDYNRSAYTVCEIEKSLSFIAG